MKKEQGSESECTRHLEFQDNKLMPLLFGDRDRYLILLQDLLGVSIFAKGNRIAITGAEEVTDFATIVLSRLYDRLDKGMVLTTSEIEAAVRLAKHDDEDSRDHGLRQRYEDIFEEFPRTGSIDPRSFQKFIWN